MFLFYLLVGVIYSVLAAVAMLTWAMRRQVSFCPTLDGPSDKARMAHR